MREVAVIESMSSKLTAEEIARQVASRNKAMVESAPDAMLIVSDCVLPSISAREYPKSFSACVLTIKIRLDVSRGSCPRFPDRRVRFAEDCFAPSR
jgi:hypothetical protein